MKVILVSLASLTAVISIGATVFLQSDSLGRSKVIAIKNIKQLGLAALLYSTDDDEILPKGTTLSEVKSEIMPYCKNEKIFVSQNPKGGQIQFNAHLAAVGLVEIDFLTRAPVFYDGKAWPGGGRPVSFADVHVRFTTARTWKAVARELKRKYRHTPKAGH